ncbi:MAG: S41 family peptidase [Polyangiaceae bacterium]
MLPAQNKGVGMNIGFPDPCLTAVGPALVPIPYPNMAMNILAAIFSPNIFLTMMPALNMASLIPMTMGDETGAPNVIFKMMGGATVGNPKIAVNCIPGLNLLCPSYGNLHNNPIGASVVPSITNVLFTYAGGDAPAEELSPDAVASLDAAMREPAAVRSRLVAGAIGYVENRVFASDAAARVHGALRGLAARGMRSLVIDLRGCPGGDLDAAIDLAAEFLPMGAEIATLVDEDGDELVRRSARSYDWRVGDAPLPIRILVDRGTASAAEVFAGALRANGRAEIVGGPTFGTLSATRVARALETGAPIRVGAGHCVLPAPRSGDVRAG